MVKVLLQKIREGGRERLETFLKESGERAFGRKMTVEEFWKWMEGYDSLVGVVRHGEAHFRRFNSKREISEKERQNRIRFAKRMFKKYKEK